MSGKVGEIARRTGISIRTLHYYDEIGLVSPSEHTESGHRIYNEEDVQRLQQILILRSLGFPLEKIRRFLAQADGSPFLAVIEQQIEQMRKEISEREKVVACLEQVQKRLRLREQTTIDEILNLMEALEMIDKYYTREQLDELKTRADALGEGGMQKAQDDWRELIETVKMEMDRGALPEDEPVKQLARRWLELIEQFTGGNQAIARSMQAMYSEEGAGKASHGILDEGTMAFMTEAIARLKSDPR